VVTGVEQELNSLLSGLKRSVRLFADGHYRLLDDLASDPENEEKQRHIQRLIDSYFPEAFGFTLANSAGDDLLDPFSERVRDQCRADIRQYVGDGYRHNIHIHPNPYGYHFDIMVPWESDAQQQGVFFVSFRPVMLSRLLANSQVSGHQLFLILSQDNEQGLIEVSAKGSRDSLNRNWNLSPQEVASIEYAKKVPDTRWQLVDIPMPKLYLEQRLRTWIQVFSLFMIFLGTGLVMLYLIRREGSRRQHVESSLLESYATLNAVFEGIGDPVYLKDPQGRYRMVNSAFACLTDKSTRDIPGLSDTQLFPRSTAKRFLHADRLVLERGEKSLVEEIDNISEEQRCCLVTRTPVKDAEGNLTGLVGIRHDITELKHAETRIRRHEQELSHVDRLNIVGEMASSIAHEINQPLGAVANCAQACVRMVSSGKYSEDKLMNALKLANEQAQRAGKIVHQIRDFARKDTRRHMLVDLDALVKETISFFQPKAREHGVTITLRLPEILPKVYGDRIQIEQVLLNLMFNGIEAMEAAASDRRELMIHCDAYEDDSIKVTITDTGPGLEPKVAARIFEPFFTTKTRGMGLGLAISRTIIESHSGHLWAEKDHPQGAAFCFSLPIDSRGP
jgi:PAS domain S-box-containing protein